MSVIISLSACVFPNFQQASSPIKPNPFLKYPRGAEGVSATNGKYDACANAVLFFF
jgi:hypothetical protein